MTRFKLAAEQPLVGDVEDTITLLQYYEDKIFRRKITVKLFLCR